MMNRQRAIAWLEGSIDVCKVFGGNDERLEAYQIALAALKEQNSATNKYGYCPICDKTIEVKSDKSMGYCYHCGHDIVFHDK